MTSQSNFNKKSLTKISDFILNEQKLDIKAYTSGHLNEDHLWKPNKENRRKHWQQIKTPNIGPTRPNSTDFVLPKSQKCWDNEFNNELNAKSIGSYEDGSISSRSYLKLPVGDKDMSLKILSSHLSKATTKAEKLNNFTKFEKDILGKSLSVDTLERRLNNLV